MTDRLRSAYEKVCRVLLDRQTPEGYWTGRLSDSALSTATAVSALCICGAEEHQALIRRGVDWLLAHRNPDGGWGDTDKSLSNVSTTLLVKSALHLAGTPQDPVCRERFASETANDEIDAIRKRYGDDQTFSVPILTNAALAGLVDWEDIPQLPFELAALPMSWFRFVKMNVVSYAIPALVAIGQVKFHFASEPLLSLRAIVRRFVQKRTLRLIQEMQPESGGYLEAAPLTSFVVMSLAAMGLRKHPIVTKGIRFLVETVREDGSWAIDTNLATWATSLSVLALGKAEPQTIDWLLSCQHKKRHPFTGASPGGWGWTNLSGAVPDADDTAAALLALASQERAGDCVAVLAGINWLLGLQNRDGGIPTFCRGWGMLPFDQSSTDITAHVIRAFQAWQAAGGSIPISRMQRAEERMFAFLKRSQQPDGSWLPLWFGNQTMPDDINPFYGTAKVLLALAETKREHAMTEKGLHYLACTQRPDGSWGNSIEETAVVVEALSAFSRAGDGAQRSLPITEAYHRGLNWLLEAVESDRFLQPAPIGLYFAKLWYYEDLYPIIFTASALRRALGERS